MIVRHQVAAAIGTLADFATMVALVELARLAPPVATVLSAITGGVVNFCVSRGWAFRERHRGAVSSQARRYALVSFGGAQLNGVLLALVLRFVALPYPLARALVAIAIGLCYSYPMHTRFVFRVVGPAPLESRVALGTQETTK